MNLRQYFLNVTLSADPGSQCFVTVDDAFERSDKVRADQWAAQLECYGHIVGKRAGFTHLCQRPQLLLRRGDRDFERGLAGCGGTRELVPEAAFAHFFNAVSYRG